MLTFTTGPGDVVVHHARTLHAAGGNRSTTRRRAISVRYCGDDARVLVRTGAPLKAYQHGVHRRLPARLPGLPGGLAVSNVEPVLVPWVPSGHGRDQPPSLRRRQPLLRGARRVHPPPRPASSGPARCSGRRSTAGSTTWSAGGSAGRWSTRRSTPIAKAGAMHDYFRGNPEGRNPLEFLTRARADPARVPRPRRAARRHGRARASTRSGCSPRSACSTRSCSRRTRRRSPSRSRRSTGGSRRTGASRTRTGSSPRRTSRSATSTGRCSELEWALDRGARVVCLRPPQ